MKRLQEEFFINGIALSVGLLVYYLLHPITGMAAGIGVANILSHINAKNNP